MILPVAFIEGLGGPELMMVLFIVLLLFGANRLPELARGLGKSVREFKKATSGVEEEFRNAMEEKPEPSEEAKRFAPRPVGTQAQTESPPPRKFPPYPPGSPPPAAEPPSEPQA
ncbi:MAG: twin-arginine translocase TatA/TatE family subunit [Candidatus Didemnitutus sp.]|nr:twin-arginine translocase TatA/TatE family subunit [Candidatus Didemnitutus sp.]